MTVTSPQRLRDTGQVQVTRLAAERYAAHDGIGLEQARLDLTELLLDATRRDDTSTGLERWRYRSRSDGLDITASVTREGPLAIVVGVSVREYRQTGSRRR